jgi:hypothetical protein
MLKPSPDVAMAFGERTDLLAGRIGLVVPYLA